MKRLFVASFNVKNLIQAGKPIYDDPKPLYSPEAYKKKVAWIRNQFAEMNAAIIGVQEVFEAAALKACLEKQEEWSVILPPDPDNLPKNALLSKHKVEKFEFISDFESSIAYFDEQIPASHAVAIPISRFARSLIKATIRLDHQIGAALPLLTVFVVHLKSKNPILPPHVHRDTAPFYDLAAGATRSLIRRAAEACEVRRLISKALAAEPEVPVLVLGDFNDDSFAVSSQNMQGEAPYYSLQEELRKQRWQQVMQNARVVQARRSTESNLYSYIYNGHYECLDNILVSNHFSDLNPGQTWRVLDVLAFNDHLRDETLGLDVPAPASDHGQIVAVLSPTNS